jgi:type II restriction/modification system DNA methylase subunit YeeA
MTPQEFIAKWRAVELKERSASQSHFNDLCRLLAVPDPVSADPTGAWFTFEKGAAKSTGGNGWADVWRKHAFAWEYKGKHKDLDAAHAQLLRYAVALENPPLLIVSDMDRIVIRTNWTNTVQETHILLLDDLLDGAKRDLLRAAFEDPERLKPKKTRDALTAEAAERFATLAQRLRARGHPPETVAHFVNRLVFCMFAEDTDLLPNKLFEAMLLAARPDPASFATHASTLFAAMRGGGLVGFQRVDWFNGGLFDDDTALPLERTDLDDLIAAARLNWSQIDPSILGTLFERGLDPGKRSQLGAHYTDRDKIMKIVNPVIVAPLLAEWAETKAAIEAAIARSKVAKSPAAATRAHNEALALQTGFLERLKAFRVLDPACGSGNFLYLALRALKDIEHRANLEAEVLGLPRAFPAVGPEAVRGIELNPYAAELARVSVWIGEIQWMRGNGFEAGRNPILRPLETIECRDALLNPDGTRAEWPDADVVVGNPPFVGNKKMIGELGEVYVEKVRAAYSDWLTGGVDFVVYWFEITWRLMEVGRLSRAGLVATQSVRRGASNDTLKRITRQGYIFEAWSDEDWTVDGAAVRVSIVCFSRSKASAANLNGAVVREIYSDLSAARGGADLTGAARLAANRGVAFQGPVKVGPFDIDGEVAREWLALPKNPNNRSNVEVVRLLLNGVDVTRRPSGRWIVDFGTMTAADASLFEAPFEYALREVKPFRDGNRRERRRAFWWQHGETVPGLKRALSGLDRAIFTPRVAKHRLFVWASGAVVPDSRVVAVARSDDTSFGILHSRFHELWSLALGGWHGVGNDPQYTPSMGFETFPFPEGLTPDIPASAYAGDPRAQAIAAVAADLNAKREAWLNPPDLVRRVPEVVPGYPDRLLPVDDAAAEVLKKRTLTNLYNARPAWLDHAHRALDEAVAEAYGWGDDFRAGSLTDDEILARLFRLNQQRSAAEAGRKREPIA